MDKLNVYLFEYLDRKYIFDINSSTILSVSDGSFNEIKNNALEDRPSSSKEINNMKKKGYLSTNRPKYIEHPMTNMVETLLKRNLPRICLQVTQNCNFRCKYCVYSDVYENRDHNTKDMDWDTAKKGIDFLIEHSQDTLSIDIGFYGGEPLLKYDLIKKCMEYVSDNIKGKMVSYTITTNGSLLNEEIVQDFLKHNVKITISLDGPKHIQDKNRVFSNDQGTFDIVSTKIRELCKKFPKLKQSLNYSMVLDPKNGFSCIENFVEYDEELFDGTSIMSSVISEFYRKDSLKYTEEFLSEWEYSKFKYMIYLIGKLSSKYDSRIMKFTFLDIIAIIKSTRDKYALLGETEHHSGPCVPGQLRLFVNSDGKFYPCEKVSENSKIMNIGNLEDGFDYDKIKKLLNVGLLTENECKSCFAIRNCSLCAMVADDGNELSRELKMKACKNIRYQFDDKLKDICALKICGFKLENFEIKGDKCE